MISQVNNNWPNNWTSDPWPGLFLLHSMVRVSKQYWQPPRPDGNIGSSKTGYQLRFKSVAESTAYSLIQRSARTSTSRATVYLVTGQLARQGMRRAMSYKVSISSFQRYANPLWWNIHTHTLSLYIYTFWLSNLTVESRFVKAVLAAVFTVSVVHLGAFSIGDWLH